MATPQLLPKSLPSVSGYSKISLAPEELLKEINRLCADSKWREAEVLIRQALSLGDDRSEIYRALGGCLASLARGAEAARAFRTALLIDPTSAQARTDLILGLDHLETTGYEQSLFERQQFWKAHGVKRYETRKPHLNNRDPDRPLRVGYVSGDFRFHSAMMVCGHIILGHDHSPAIKPYLYSFLPHKQYDRCTEVYQAHCEWRDMSKADDDDIVERIRDDKIDILMDLGGYTLGRHISIFCFKPAPIQATAWGYGAGTGLPCFDAFFADKVSVSEAMRVPPLEPVVDMPCTVSYDPPPIDIPVLPRDGPITFGVFQRAVKIEPRVMECWNRILDRVPGSRMLMKSASFDDVFQAQVKEAFGANFSRVEFRGSTGFKPHLEAHGEVDILLDTFGQTGGVTTLEGLWSGVPTVTLLGIRPGTRGGAAIMTALGEPGFIANTRNEYVDVAVKWATDRAALASVRAGLREKLLASPICKDYLSAVETAYRTLWRTWCAKG